MNKAIWYILGVLAGLAYWRRQDIADVTDEIMATLTRSQFVTKYGPMARAGSAGTGLFPSVTMAQAILESNNGNSSLSREAKNFFGIKADSSWKGAYVSKPTTEYVNGNPVTVIAKFRAYETPADSFADRAKFLTSMSRYRNAGVFGATTPEAQATALQKAGYATDPNYSNLLITLINKNNLKQFDV